jgi:phage gp37-like protein
MGLQEVGGLVTEFGLWGGGGILVGRRSGRDVVASRLGLLRSSHHVHFLLAQ